MIDVAIYLGIALLIAFEVIGVLAVTLTLYSVAGLWRKRKDL